MTKRWTIALTLMAALVVPGTTWAHEGHDHIIMGTVTARSERSLDVKTPSGEVLSIALTQKTTVSRNKKKADFKDVQIGHRVVVNIGNGEDPLVAKDIQVGVAAAAAPAAPAH